MPLQELKFSGEITSINPISVDELVNDSITPSAVTEYTLIHILADNNDIIKAEIYGPVSPSLLGSKAYLHEEYSRNTKDTSRNDYIDHTIKQTLKVNNKCIIDCTLTKYTAISSYIAHKRD